MKVCAYKIKQLRARLKRFLDSEKSEDNTVLVSQTHVSYLVAAACEERGASEGFGHYTSACTYGM